MLGDGRDGVAAYDLSEADDRVRQVCFGDVNGRPEGVGQLLLADEMFRAADQTEERVEGFGLERDWIACPLEETIAGVKLEVGEPVGSLD